MSCGGRLTKENQKPLEGFQQVHISHVARTVNLHQRVETAGICRPGACFEEPVALWDFTDATVGEVVH